MTKINPHLTVAQNLDIIKGDSAAGDYNYGVREAIYDVLDEAWLDTNSAVNNANTAANTATAAASNAEQKAAAAQNATVAALSAANNIAEPFDASKNYDAGDYVLYNDRLYRFIKKHTAGAWINGDVTNVTLYDEISVINDGLSISPTTKPGYWTPNGEWTPPTSSNEVVTEFLIPVGKTIAINLSYTERRDMWLVVCYKFATGVKRRDTIINSSQIAVSWRISIPDDVVEMSFSYRTYDNDATFSVAGVMKNIERFVLKPDSILEDLEPVLTITSSASTRGNVSNDRLTGLFLFVAEMASTEYTYDIRLHDIAESNVYGDRPCVCYCENTRINFYIKPSASAGHILKAYRIDEGRVWSLIDYSELYPELRMPITKYYPVMRINDLDITPSAKNRVSSDIIRYNGSFRIHLSDDNYKAAVQIFNVNTREKIGDTSWVGNGYVFKTNPSTVICLIVAKQDDSKFDIGSIPDDLLTLECLSPARVTRPSNEEIGIISKAIENKVSTEELSDLKKNINQYTNNRLWALRNETPCYDHLHVNSNYAIIPHESGYHLRLSKSMGFGIIEANVGITSDDVFFVNHLNNGTFGSYFHHVDGVTDISNVSASSVTWEWIVNNVRYNAEVQKYQTQPIRLEEFLKECSSQNIIPFVQYNATSTGFTSHDMAKEYLGESGYIAYNGSRSTVGSAPIYIWDMRNNTVEDILANCNRADHGAPLIWGTVMSRFDDATAKAIIDALHENGYFVGISYDDSNWQKYREMGADFNGTQNFINRITDGRICSYSSVFNWDDYDITGDPDSNGGMLTFSNGGTIKPKVPYGRYAISGYDYEIVFSGTVNITSANESAIITNTSMKPIWKAVPVYNSAPTVTFAFSSGAVVQDVYFKASRFN